MASTSNIYEIGNLEEFMRKLAILAESYIFVKKILEKNGLKVRRSFIDIRGSLSSPDVVLAISHDCGLRKEFSIKEGKEICRSLSEFNATTNMSLNMTWIHLENL